MRAYFEEILPHLGYDLVAAAANGKQMVDCCDRFDPDLVIADIKMPDMDGIEAVTKVCRRRPLPVILISAYHDAETVARAESDFVLAYLVKPIKQADLQTTIPIAMRRFSELRALNDEAANLRQALRDRKIIERAKGIVMKLDGVGEQDAFRTMQKIASSRNKRLIEVAEAIIATTQVVPDRGT
ncbi:putative transcriptional regulatory protein pdtaR [Planctomycetes bacterium Pan216]|uniref:Putative transcriptional regulatory protein pdtaR n=2 Tax=Kolteria novifilia TaxID=2527975 RepID=A0A518B1L0_9BACT|nr:putative transcriptional regulatory protein pdtaR [Planctomycetes bacterium Pan216]